MKKFTSLFVALTLASGLLTNTASAQFEAPAQSPKVTGTMDIQFATRTNTDSQGKPQAGVKDVYKLNLDVAETMNFAGTIEYLPPLFKVGGYLTTQSAQLSYDIPLTVRNPQNLAQSRTVGKFVGIVPIDSTGAYQYGNGNLRIAVNATGKASDFSSAFKGVAKGKAPEGSGQKHEDVKKQAFEIWRQVKGEAKKITVSNYDPMSFDNLVLAAGPSANYGEVRVNGKAVYDYDRSAWNFTGLTLQYRQDDKDVVDRISGNIKWVEDPNRAQNGKGRYEFDVRVNEPEVKGEAAAFAAADDEAAFFASDSGVPSLTGTTDYVDTPDGAEEPTTTASKVTFNLVGNGLSKAQVVNLTKLLQLVMVVPMNND